MFRLWGKMWKDNHMLKDLVIDDDSEDCLLYTSDAADE